jgi:hypothetical protein
MLAVLAWTVPLAAASLPPEIQGVRLRQGLVLTQSAKIESGTYALPNDFADAKNGSIRIEGDGITVDFQGAVLEGTPQTVEPDERKGTGLVIRGKNVTVKNLRVRGYKVGVAAWSSPGLKLENVDASYNWKQRLMSTLDREDSSDWMSFHKNEADEWLRFGAAFYLRDCDGFEVKNCRAVGGQCGLMLTDCENGLVWNNDFSFLSAIGIGMYRSSGNRILHNNVDWCVRGYSHGKWNRGQDSAGILIYEQSHKNVFAYNSVTHGGDGFFLWAGQTTMDTGNGGCNDNLLYGNDFSHAPTNGIEATFSRNNFVNNLVLECWHGIWGGYSYESKVIGNVFGLNAQAIAWEHGQDNLVASNIFHRDVEGVVLWQNKTQDPNWGYPKNRDTRSRDWKIEKNLFSHQSAAAISLRDTAGVSILENRFLNNGRILKLQGETPGLVFRGNDGAGLPEELPGEHEIELKPDFRPLPATMLPSGNVILGLDPHWQSYLRRFELTWNPWLNGGPAPAGPAESSWNQEAARPFAPKPLAGGRDPFLKRGTVRGRRYILVDHWGPYDFRSPVLWPRGEVKDREQTFELIGPAGVAVVAETKGARVREVSADGGQSWSAPSGRIPVPSLIRVAYDEAAAIERSVELDYVGEEVSDYRGVVTPAGRPFRFGYRQFFAPVDWTVKFFAWNEETDPRTKPEAFQKLLQGEPVKSERVDRINYAGNVPGVPADRFATLAEGHMEMPPGEYVLNVTTDDGVRVWLDGKLLVDQWHWQGPTLYSRKVSLGGKHHIRVEHFEIDGYSALKVELAPAR